MTTERAFLDDVREHPDDDVPRLVFADWLDDHGQGERADFIRVQCELAKLPLDDERRPELEARELRLLNGHHKGWARPMRHLVKSYEFRRGFIEGVKLGAGDFLAHAAELYRLAPIRAAHLVGYADCAARLAGSRHLAGLRSLALTDPRFTHGQTPRLVRGQPQPPPNAGGTDPLRTLLQSRNLKALRELEVRDHCLGQAGAEMLAGAPHMAQVEGLDLRNNDFQEGDVAALADSRYLNNLRRLRLGACFSWDPYDHYPERDGIGLLPPELGPLVGRLELLDLGSCGMLPRGLLFLGQVPRSVPLTALLLERSTLGHDFDDALDSFRDLLRSPLLGSVRVLDLSSCYLDDFCMSALAAAPLLAGVVHLGLRNNPLDKKALSALMTSPHLGKVQRLELASWNANGEDKSGDARLKELAHATTLPRLAALDLRSNQISPKGVSSLADSPLPARLTWLDLRRNYLGDSAVKALLGADWPRLAWLDLRDNGLSGKAKQARFGVAVRY